jgi:outer membrane protein OmpA-like peptidoglycan-associated protein
MRRRLMLLVFLCLSAGAFAMARVAQWHLHVDASLNTHPALATAHPPLAALDTSPASDGTDAAPAVPATVAPPAADRTEKRPDVPVNQVQNAAAAPNQPKIDVARISTTGAASVFAGHAAPGAVVTVLENGVPVETATANDNGDWSLVTEHKFSGPDPKISLRTGAPPAQPENERMALNAAQPPRAVASDSGSAPVSPSRQLLMNFENKVATAREEEARTEAGSATAKADAGPAPAQAASSPPSATPIVAPAPATSTMTTTLRDTPHLESASIPVPMTFVFDQATLTADGEKTATHLLEYLQLKKFAAVTLSGHADERGTAEYNMELSRKRLETVSAFLRKGGYNGKMTLVPEGASEPFKGVDRSKFSQDDLMQLDRRVELRNAM